MAVLALCAGSNYPGTANALAGCANDARDWSQALSGRGAQVTLLLDHDATRQNLIDHIFEVLGRLGSGDIGVITWSGHGTWVPDLDGDEADRRDEALCPDDFARAGMLTDDDLYELFAARPRGSHAVMVADSCFSGTMQRFADTLTPKPDHHLVRFLPPAVWAADAGISRRQLVEAAAAPVRGRMRAGALALSACSDREYAYDAWFDGRPNGAFTRAALDALAGLPDGSTYRGWLRAIRQRLPSVDYPQSPQMDGTSTQKRMHVFAA